MLSSLAPARRRLVLVVGGLVVVAAVAIAIAAAGGGDSAAVTPVSQARAGPVVLVPGYGGSTTGVTALADVLRAHGKDATVFQLPGDGQGDLKVQAEALASTVDAVLKRTGAPSVDVIGYSAGGVVVRLWIADDGGGSQARRVITLGSPQHGTDVASVGADLLPGACPTACQQLAPDSDLLDSLNDTDETPPGPSWVSIWTTKDDVVLPPDSASLAGALDITVQSVCISDSVKHTGLPHDPTVQAMILAELQDGPPRALGPADCVTS